MNKKVLFLTGTRADFGKMEPLGTILFKAGYHITYFVTGMHMMEKYGLTKYEVTNSNYSEIFEFVNQRSGDNQDIILSKTISGFSDFLAEHKQDLIVFHGDRVEAFACSIVSAMNYVKCAHIEGGEVSGTIDELLRHAITKLSMAHFVSSLNAKDRILKMGEKTDNVYLIGSPELDRHSEKNDISITNVRERYNIEFEDYGICIFHPVTSELSTIETQAELLFKALIKTNRNFVIILPNNDPGSESILSNIKLLDENKSFRILPSMRFLYFSRLMKSSSLIIGNSSIGVREAPFLGIPSINIGTRQTNRSSAKSIKNIVNPDISKLMKEIENFWGKKFKSDKTFGFGNASERFLKILSNEMFWRTSLQKYFIEN